MIGLERFPVLCHIPACLILRLAIVGKVLSQDGECCGN